MQKEMDYEYRWYPFKMIRRHNLKDGNYERRSRFCRWFLHQCNNPRLATTQPAFTCSKLTIETLEQGVKYVQS